MALNDPQDFAVALLGRLGIKPNPYNVRAIVGWEKAEGGHWNNSARYNPLNTTQDAPGAAPMNSVGVKAYGSWEQGLDATAKTLKNGRYGQILRALRGRDPGAVAGAIGSSPWGTNASLVSQTIGAAPTQRVAAPSLEQPRPPKAPAPGGVDQGAQRASLISSYLSNQNNPDALTQLATGLLAMGVPKQIAAKAVPATGRPGTSPQVAAPGSVPDEVRTLIERANRIDRKQLPYVWGGGHARSGVPDRGTGRDPGIGFDCSGAVAAVLGIDPRHSSQFASWGKPGRAKGGKGVTVYANNTHVLMEINGKFFGTSRTNPGGGAGWIPRAAISGSYLAGFTARHM